MNMIKQKSRAHLLLILVLLLISAPQIYTQTPFLVKDIQPGQAGSSPGKLTNMNGTLFFSAISDGNSGRELWKSDGTVTGTVLVKDINPGGGSIPQQLTDVNGTLFFGADDGATGRELWKSDGTTAGTVLVKDINPGAAGALPLLAITITDVNGTAFFNADDGTIGLELWKSDGTTAGTVLVKDINAGPDSSLPLAPSLTNVNGTLFFGADESTAGLELWKSDGTAGGTVLVKDINPGPSGSLPLASPTPEMTNINGTLFFRASDGVNGFELWKSDGTAAGTVLVKDINPGSRNSNPDYITELNGQVFFGANDGLTGLELWKSDGTAAGTVLVKDIVPGPLGSAVRNLADVNGTLYFAAFNVTNGYELWQSDGTTAGTVLVEDINPGPNSSIPGPLITVDSTLFFSAVDGITGSITSGGELWRLGQPVTITLTPSNPPIVIPPGGGQFQFTITLSNISGVTQSTQVWNAITLPNGETIGPTIGPVNPSIASGEMITKQLTQNVPGGAPAGQYTYTFNIGTFPDTIDASDSFTFTKSGAIAKDGPEAQIFSDWGGEWGGQGTVAGAAPESFRLEQNYPNPFNPSTTISYQLPKAASVKIVIYDLTGRQVRALVNIRQEAGSYSVLWDGRDQAGQAVASGLYIYHLRAGRFTQTRKMLIVK